MTTRLGYDVRTAMEAEISCQINYKSFGSALDTLDDLFGAINQGTFKIAVRGQTARSPISGKAVFEIDKVGIYCRDTYDFNEHWFRDEIVGLGIWSRDRCLSKVEMATHTMLLPNLKAMHFPGFVPARNVDFRRWQSARNEGGDFYIYSDILWRAPHVSHILLA